MHNMENASTKTVVALGMFDGMHLGHEALIRRAAALAAETGSRCAVYSFANHPLSVLGGAPKLLTGPEERRARMLHCGADEVVLEPFTKELAALSPKAFIDRLLGRWNVRAAVAGYNYSFGAGGAGNEETLRMLGHMYGFATEVLPPILEGGQPVSSSRIRMLLEAGDVACAAALLGRPYSLSGLVVQNLGNGTRLGFPTANLEPEPWRALPMPGVYVTCARVGERQYSAVTNVGTNPTLRGRKLTVETHLLSYEGGALYGQALCVDFCALLREERVFPSVDALKSQIAADARMAAAFK